MMIRGTTRRGAISFGNKSEEPLPFFDALKSFC